MITYRVYIYELGFFIGFAYPECGVGKQQLGIAYDDERLGIPSEVKCIAIDKKTVTRWSRKYRPAEYPGDATPNEIAKVINAFATKHDVVVIVGGTGVRKTEEPKTEPKRKKA